MVKRFRLVKCVYNNWGLIDRSLEDVDQLVLIHTSKSSVNELVNVLNQLNDENEQLKQLLDYADDIIKTHTNHDVVRQWENIKGDVE